MELRLAERPSGLPFTGKDDGRRVPATPQEVLGEVEPRVGEELRARHLLKVVDNAGAHLAANRGKRPDGAPEVLGTLDGEPVKVVVRLRRHAEILPHRAHERGEAGSRDAIGGRDPQWRGHGWDYIKVLPGSSGFRGVLRGSVPRGSVPRGSSGFFKVPKGSSKVLGSRGSLVRRVRTQNPENPTNPEP
jgi:hypothetical protein